VFLDFKDKKSLKAIKENPKPNLLLKKYIKLIINIIRLKMTLRL
jgi:hypothetical protein